MPVAVPESAREAEPAGWCSLRRFPAKPHAGEQLWRSAHASVAEAMAPSSLPAARKASAAKLSTTAQSFPLSDSAIEASEEGASDRVFDGGGRGELDDDVAVSADERPKTVVLKDATEKFEVVGGRAIDATIEGRQQSRRRPDPARSPLRAAIRSTVFDFRA